MLLNSWLSALKQAPRRRRRKSASRKARVNQQRTVSVEELETRALLSALSVSQSATPAVVDLTVEGATDWASWACGQGAAYQGFLPSDTSPYARKDGGTGIGAVAYDGTLDAGGTIPLRYLAGDLHSTISWADGDSGAIWPGDSSAHPNGTGRCAVVTRCIS
jgi:hypothetical protein